MGKWRLSPSAASTWMTCPASVSMSRKAPPEPPSEYAEEGTAFHSLCESLARLHILGKGAQGAIDHMLSGLRDKWDVDEMEHHSSQYVPILRERMPEGSQLLLEQRMFTGVPTCWGTADAVIIRPGEIEILDIKYGAGTPVRAEGNPQLRLYAVAALDTFGELDDFDRVCYTVWQPRAQDTHLSTESTSAEDLRSWRDELIPIAEMALSDNATFSPSRTACRWCDAAGVCRARAESIIATEGLGEDPDLLSREAMSELLGRVAGIRAWCSALETAAFALARATPGAIPGYKVVMSGGRRFVSDLDGLLGAMESAGFSREDLVRQKPQTFTVLERLAGGRQKFDELAGEYISKSSPTPSLVRESDKRPAADRASEAKEAFR